MRLSALSALTALSAVACRIGDTGPRADAEIRAIEIRFADTPAPDLLLPGESYALVARAYDVNNLPIDGLVAVWSSADTTVARVTQEGILTLLRPGNARIFARFAELARVLTIHVDQPVASLSLNFDSLRLVPGGGAHLTYQLRAADGSVLQPRPVTWTLSDPTLAVVFDTGGVVTLKPGTFVVRAAREGAADSATFYVANVRYTSAAAGGTFACALSTDAEAWCWGANDAGQLGRGAIYPRVLGQIDRIPGLVVGGHRFRLIAAGYEHACALAQDGSTWCWGRNAEGQLGDGTTQARDVPVRVAGNAVFDTLVAGEISTCGLDAAGQAWCWGRNATGQMGTGAAASPSPTPVAGGVRFRMLATTQRMTTGQWHSCGLDLGGQAWCWGRNLSGQLGDGTRPDITDPGDAPWGHEVPTPVAGGHTFTTLAVGAEFSCGLLVTGERACWGSNAGDALGGWDQEVALAPAIVPDGLAWTTFQTGIAHGCGIVSGNAVYCWGRNDSGALGQPRPVPSTPIPRAVGGYFLVQISTSGTRSCGITTLGTALCWGAGAFVPVYLAGQ